MRQEDEPTCTAASEFLQSAGDLVHVRGQRWRVVDVRAYGQCQLIALTGVGPGNRGLARRVLTPFDTVATIDRETPLQFVSRPRWRRVCRALLADDAPAVGLRTARSARITLLPHQLEPALAVVGGRGSRVLLADDVGLGKTIQAGLIIAELRARGMAERVLIVTPPGLRDQWAAELSARFDIAASIVDVRELRRRTAILPVGVNPWSTVPIAIASVDYVKRPDVLRSVVSCRWDVLVIDEAHAAAGDSDRRAAAGALAARAAWVLLLTATPHNGDVHAFDALCDTGAHADPLLVFRRTRGDVKLGVGRRVHQLHVRPSAAELRMHALLDAFTRAVRVERRSADVWLPLAVLHKRALSSARSLEQSVERRLAALGRASGGHVHQLDLPLTDPGGEFDAGDDAPGWATSLTLADQSREEHLLGALAAAAHIAARQETKVSAIIRLLRRVTEPIVIFTEYRDTLIDLHQRLARPVLVLHGGLTRQERAAALDAFVNGRRRILLATDAAGEGLNLHRRCRLVINLELPWNPMRLEQRIGRVDRIGQQRTVHVFHLIARETNETRVLDQLTARVARAQQDISTANPLENDDRAIAKLVIAGPDDGSGAARLPSGRTAERSGTDRIALCLTDDAQAEAARLVAARRLSGAADDRMLGLLEGAGAWIVTASLRRTRLRLRGRVIAILRVEHENGQGRTSHSMLVPLAVTAPRLLRRPGRSEVVRILRSMTRQLQAAAATAAGGAGGGIVTAARALAGVRLRREEAIARARRDGPRSELQPGLFDRRAERAARIVEAASNDASADQNERLADCAGATAITIRTPRLLLILLP
ncbi:MAG: helicase-related protein [Acidobacteriota bacterium]